MAPFWSVLATWKEEINEAGRGGPLVETRQTTLLDALRMRLERALRDYRTDLHGASASISLSVRWGLTMAEDFRVWVGFFDHHKTRKLIRRLGESAVINLLRLWEYCTAHREDGSLYDLDAEDIAFYARYPGDPDEFVSVLTELKFIEQHPVTGALVIHDWDGRQPWVARALERRQSARANALIRWHKEGYHVTAHSGCPLCEKGADDTVQDAPRMPGACGSHTDGIADGNAPRTAGCTASGNAPFPTVPTIPNLSLVACDDAVSHEKKKRERPETSSEKNLECKPFSPEGQTELTLDELNQEGCKQLGPLGGGNIARLMKFLPIRRWEWDAARSHRNARSWGYVMTTLEDIRQKLAAPPPPPAGDAPTSLDGILAELERIASGSQREPHSDPVAEAVIRQRGGRRRLGVMDDKAFRLEKAKFIDDYRHRLRDERPAGVAIGAMDASEGAPH